MKIIPINYDQLKEYSKIPISFSVNSIYDIVHTKNRTKNDPGIELIEKQILNPYEKNYDDYENPLDWIKKWDLKWNSDNWGFFLSQNDNGEITGGASIALNVPGMQMCEGKDDLAVLWDIRVHPAHRGKSIGKSLFLEAEKFARSKKCSTLKIETQNTNVPACKFYKSMGCTLGKITPHAYSEFPEEIQFFFYKNL